MKHTLLLLATYILLNESSAALLNAGHPLTYYHSVTPLPTEHKMPIGNVHDIYHDREGYVWYSTEEGLLRDNGYQIDVFCSNSHKRPLASNFITDIAEDHDRHIWFGTTKGTYVLDKRDYSIHPVSVRGTQGMECEALIALSDGTIWLATPQALFHLNAQEKVLQRIDTSSRRRGPRYANTFVEDSQHTLWLLETMGNICRYNRNTRQFVPCQWPAGFDPRRMVEDTRNACFWVATGGHGIVRFVPSALGSEAQSTTQPETLPQSGETNNKAQVIDITLDASTPLLWATAMDGLHAYDIRPDGQLAERNLDGLLPAGKNIVDGMSCDSWGNVWVAGFSPHTFILSSSNGPIRRDTMAQVQQFAGTSPIGDFVISDGDALWLWDPRLGLELYNPCTRAVALGMHQPEDALMPGSGVIAPRSKGGMWMASGNQVLRLWHEGMIIHRQLETQLPDVDIFGLYESPDGTLWAATSQGLMRSHQEQGTIRSKEQDNWKQVTDPGETTFRIAVDQHGNRYYHAQRRGLLFYNARTQRARRLLPPHEHCTAMTLTPDGTLWFGTDLGRVMHFRSQWSVPVEVASLGNPSGARILDIKRDRKGHIWAVSSQSVKEWNPANKVCRTLMASNPHIAMDYFRTMATWGDSICIAGSGGFVMVAPSGQKRETRSKGQGTKPILSSFVIDGEKQYIGTFQQDITLSPTTELIEANLSTLNHLHATQTQFAYRLCPRRMLGGWDLTTRWNQLSPGNNTILFNSLGKGEYLLQARATDDYGHWSQIADVIVINRQPAWWETWWAQLSYALCAALLVTIALHRFSRRIRQKRTAQMDRQLTEMKFKFFTNISHELRTPITLMMVPLDGMLRKSTLSPQDHTRLETIYNHANQLLGMINQLLDFRRLELGETQLHLQQGNLSMSVSAAVEPFQPLASRKGIALTSHLGQDGTIMEFDHEKVHHIVSNLLSNALKFTESGGRVMVTLKKDTDVVQLCVSDTGRGIPEKDIPHLFERYYQSSHTSAEGGTGIGLHFVSELVRMHGGTISVESQLGQGTTFTVSLPLQGETPHPANKHEQQETRAEDKTLLLVEDNVELRHMMAEHLANEGYHIIQAGNGEEALIALKQEGTDLIISDIMMPKMDGLQLCQAIKNDIELSHLPIILLTAKAGDENQLQGYKMGADFYITKPFSTDILLNRIQHLTEQKRLNQKTFQHQTENDFTSLTRSKLDEEFLKRAIDKVQQNLSETGYGVEQFSSDMCVSRMTLYRKIQGITGQSPSDFIITIRLKQAAKMLKETSLPITRISEKTGFSNPSYFTKCFRKTFGQLPKDYRST